MTMADIVDEEFVPPQTEEEFVELVKSDSFDRFAVDSEAGAWLRSDENLDRFHRELQKITRDLQHQLTSYNENIEDERWDERPDWEKRARRLKWRIDQRLSEVNDLVKQRNRRLHQEQMKQGGSDTWSRRQQVKEIFKLRDAIRDHRAAILEGDPDMVTEFDKELWSVLPDED